MMAEYGAESEQPQRRLGDKKHKNGELTDSDLPEEEKKQRDKEDHESLVLWKRPLLTLYYFSLELFITLKGWMWRLWHQRQTVFGLVMLLILFSIAYHIEGPHQKVTDLLMCCECKNTIATVCDVTSLLQLQRRCMTNYCNRVLKGTYFVRNVVFVVLV
uniref:Uncharacterized protein n=1 Tax=Poecilia mexicana TaxID=48701 RepID=A0A3B3X7Z0_9TELE